METLFSLDPIHLDLPDATFIYYPNFLNQEKADLYFEKLLQETPWQQDDITIFGKKIAQPRLTALYGNLGKPYSYSGITMHPIAWSPLVWLLKEEVETIAQHSFTSVLLNLYRNEKDSNGWHADNEKELGQDPIIASLSLGETRKFQIKHTTNKNIKCDILLEHGSLLLMKEGAQVHYKHQLPKATQPKNTRINLTFRTVF
ncbi:alpha-ketoglutarate-dependent dioxygenase AlkB [Flavobacterium sp. 20NA77.7]|uniref:Alpha-ketoglutarate-dependent dioxygenase AlkB n=1 Tax=Flavobacterium nakdongensis TaxID=3073563 RepID=A0ABY9RDK5_9FLAO|nr:alpha-ketoglutarate-dependent dioxygenase AlkB [Flavobacterium sp. 20NA77.7]WMW78385.1 alpha-ketoglutarate-dependent dioxygenase AlkB [Flavobacterium sp. 20NA77.7]